MKDERAYYDVVPLSIRYPGFRGVQDFYQIIEAAIPDFRVVVTGEYDTLGDESGRLLAERIYYDNETLLRQMRGEENAMTGVGLAERND